MNQQCGNELICPERQNNDTAFLKTRSIPFGGHPQMMVLNIEWGLFEIRQYHRGNFEVKKKITFLYFPCKSFTKKLIKPFKFSNELR